MSGAPVSFDRVIPEETQGPMPVEAPTTLASGSLDSFHHVEAVMKDDNVSTGALDSQDWEMVTEMVEDTDNAATHFLQGKHVIDLEGPAPNLQDSIEKMMSTMEKMKLGSTVCQWRCLIQIGQGFQVATFGGHWPAGGSSIVPS